jgi:hypothetical protein
MKTEVAIHHGLAWLAPSRGPCFGLISSSFFASTTPRKAVATMVPDRCQIDVRNGNHPRRRD